MRRSATLALLGCALAMSGCGLLYGDDDDSSSGGAAPRIESSFPGPSVQDLTRGESIVFSARGSDVDSLELDWTFSEGEAFVAGGDVDDGFFDVSWTMAFDESQAGQSTEVLFEVSDGNIITERSWAVQLEP